MPAKPKGTTTGKQQRRDAATQPRVPARDPRVWQLCLGLAAAVIALYWRVLGNQFVNLDDDVYVWANSHVKAGLTLNGLGWAFTNAANGNWHPLTWISHMLDVQFFGMDAGPHHMVSVLWHAANAAVLLYLLWRMTGRLWRSAFVAALFAFHPLRVESVAWVAERKDVLSAFFYLCTLGAYAWYARRTQSRRRYAVVAATLALALMSKPSAVTAPFLLLLLDYWPLERKERLAVLLREKLPLFALAATVSVATYVSQRGAMEILKVPFPARLANALVSYPRYLGKLFWPHPLAVIYPYPSGVPVLGALASCLLLAAITALVLWQGRRFRYLPVGWFWFLGAMVPMAGIVQVGWQAYADRYTYIPSIGLSIALVWLAADVIEARKWRLAAPIAAAVILPALALTTWSQLPYWYDDVTLFQHAIASTSENPTAEYHLGKDFADLGRNAEAIPHLRKMIRLEPAYAQAYYMLGNAQAGQSDDASAIRSFSDALRLKPNYAEAYYARATLTIKANNPVAAETDLRNAINCGLAPEWEAQAHNGLGVILGERGNLPAAVSEFQQAVRVQPEMVEAQRNLAQTLAAQGRIREAVSQLNQALIATHGDPSIRQLLYSLMPPGGGPPAEPATAPRGH